MRNKIFTRIIITTLLVTLLTFNVGRVTRVSALAAPVPEVAPVFDTQIYQFTDYYNNVLTEPQHDILYFVLGSWLFMQSASSQYTINDPFETEEGVINWFKSMGLKLTESLLQFGIGYDPVTGTDLRKELGFLAWYAMGAADYASKFTSWNDFITDFNNSNDFYLPFTPQLQMGINTVLGLNGGLYDWSIETTDFVTNLSYPIISMSDTQQAAYFELVSPYNLPNPRCVQSSYYNSRYLNKDDFFNTYNLIFVNTSTHYIYLVNSLGDSPVSFSSRLVHCNSSGVPSRTSTLGFPEVYTPRSYDPALYSTISDLVQDFYDNVFNNNTKIFYSDYIQHVYAGSTWDSRVEIFNQSDLNFLPSIVEYYQQVQNDYLLDIKGLISDLVDVTNLYPILLDHLFDNNGTQVTNPAFIQVSIELPDDNPLPVNLNDIQDYTDNEYLDVVRERVDAFSDTVGSFVAFWHNIDYEIVYAVFGSALIVLLGAFIGKWGHS